MIWRSADPGDRKPKASEPPEWGQSYANLECLLPSHAKTARLGPVGMTLVKPFGILVEGWGEGVAAPVRGYRRDRRHRRDRKDNTSPLINTDDTDRTKLKPTANEA
jgi:hypothetical protein